MHSCVSFDVEKHLNTFTARSFHSLEAPQLKAFRFNPGTVIPWPRPQGGTHQGRLPYRARRGRRSPPHSSGMMSTPVIITTIMIMIISMTFGMMVELVISPLDRLRDLDCCGLAGVVRDLCITPSHLVT